MDAVELTRDDRIRLAQATFGMTKTEATQLINRETVPHPTESTSSSTGDRR